MSDFSFDKDKFGFKKEAFKTYSLTREQRENRRIRNLRKKNLPKGKITVFDQYSLGDILCVYRMFKDKFPKLSPIHFMMLFTLYELEHFTSITIESLLKTKRKTAYVIVSSLSK
jgi:5'-3' exonuclease